ncbi:extracellular solute-binding protein [Psychromicrobium xiongbiense]|uniref:extracellular solute-binding protein n=1 Tax=Psychromicrobium xiongbiense TaxID=3051184 RepID=UPI002552BFAB|nr:extracellular solute-binding protein [Psychromicrobium sp. YIM S02556]
MKDSVSTGAQKWLTDEFAKKFPGSTLTIEEQVWDGIVPKLQTALASAESTPDIIELGNTQAPTFCAVGALTDLTDMKDTLGGKDLTQSLVDLGTANGKMYAAPFYAGSRIFIYRKDLFEAAGVKVPTTIDELTKAAATLQTANASKPHFSALQLPGISNQSAFAWVFTNGGRLATQSGDKWAGGLSSPESQKALAQLQEVWKTGSTTGPVTDTTISSAPYTPFNAGECAMFFGFNFHVKKIDPALVSAGKVGYFAFPPATAGGVGKPFAGGSNVAISAKSKNQAMSKEALKLIFSKDFQEAFAKDGGWVPGNLSFAGALGTDDLSKLTVDAVRNSVGTPAAKNWALVESAKVVDDFFVAMGNLKDPVSLAKTADDKIASILNGK